MRYPALIVAGLALFLASQCAYADPREHDRSAQPNGAQPPQLNQPAPPDQRGTEASPLAVKVMPPPRTAEEIAQENEDRQEKSRNDETMIKLTGALAVIGALQFLVFLLQLIVFGLQARRLKQSIEKMDEIAKGQTADMRASIGEASRAAGAMEIVAASMAENVASIKNSVSINREIADRQKLVSEMQLRAYITASIGGAVYQDRKNNLKFEGIASIVNTGQTPAHKVVHNTQSAILPVPLPKDYVLPQYSVAIAGENMVGPHQDRTLRCVVSDYVDENSVKDIKVVSLSSQSR